MQRVFYRVSGTEQLASLVEWTERFSRVSAKFNREK